MATGQPDLATHLIRSNVEFPDWKDRVEMWRNHGVMGWADGFEGKATTSWTSLAQLGEDWPWLSEVFGEPDEFRAALSAYYMYLNLFEYVEALKTIPIEQINPKTLRLEIPICYESESDDIKRRAYSILLSSATEVKNMWQSRGLTDETVLANWEKWTGVCAEFVQKVYSHFWHARLTNVRLISDLLAS